MFLVVFCFCIYYPGQTPGMTFAKSYIRALARKPDCELVYTPSRQVSIMSSESDGPLVAAGQ